MSNLYAILESIHEAEGIETINGGPEFSAEAKDQIVKYYAKNNWEWFEEIMHINSDSAASSNIDYFAHLRASAWLDIEKELMGSVEWSGFVYYQQAGQHKQAHESMKESSLREAMKRTLNPNN